MSVQYVRLVRARASSVVLLWETLWGCRTTYLQTPALLSTFPFEWKGSDGCSSWAVTWVSPPRAYFTNLSECDRLVTLTNLYADAHQQGGELALESLKKKKCECNLPVLPNPLLWLLAATLKSCAMWKKHKKGVGCFVFCSFFFKGETRSFWFLGRGGVCGRLDRTGRWHRKAFMVLKKVAFLRETYLTHPFIFH